MYSQRLVFELGDFTCISGQIIRDARIGYETYGTLNAAKDNAILVCHHHSGNAHAAGRYDETDSAPGWWDTAIGPGKVLDTNRYFIVCSDSLTNLNARDGRTVTTGPATIDSDTGKPYGADFPLVTVTDFVRVQKRLMEHLSVDKLVAVAGPSGGSVQAIEWSVEFPEAVPRVIAVISPGLYIHPYAAAMMECWCRPILLDPAWNHGHYDSSSFPINGLVETLRLTTLTALSFDAIENQFGYAPADVIKDPAQSLAHEFKADAMLRKIAETRAQNIDANNFLYMVRAYKLYDARERIHRARAKYLFLPADSDLLFPPHLSETAVQALQAAGRDAKLFLLKGTGGHFDGLSQMEQARLVLQEFLAE